MMTSFATLTIGQAPRSDIMPLLTAHLPDEPVTHFGLLDGLSREQIEQRYAPQEGDAVLVAVLLDGSQILLSAANAERGLQEKIDQLEAQGCTTILLLCGGEFGQLHASSALLIEPERMIPPLIGAMVGTHRAGIVVPVESQIGWQANKWRKLEKPPCFAVASPYLTDDQALKEAAKRFAEQGAEVVVLDCIGYNHHHVKVLEQHLDVPVLLANVLMVQLAAELVA
ncbi:AroM family protein [Rahnella sp. FC061912-K]|uniref:AroM family protein n=1 Tax=Rahnella rivi TaxID=2816249 RepID=UPI001C26E3DA|nr:AroM family protein [Rahnella rivi]MBU9833115.1 AroM family protein [Rahnella rivi]